jgi:lipoate-protein ligase A
VILGRFQSTASEVDIGMCENYGVQIARRFTGGGAVFHDEGNLNFTIVNHRNGAIFPSRLYEDASSIVIGAFTRLGVKATFLSPNSILVGNEKVSGAAAAFGNGFALWHNSILVSANVETLELVLDPSKKNDSTPFVRSRWHPVTNLEAVLSKPISLDQVKSQLVRSLQAILCIRLLAGGLNADEETWLRRLYEGKYSSPEWNQHGDWKEI